MARATQAAEPAAVERPEPMASLPGEVHEVCLHNEGAEPYLAVGIKLEGHAKDVVVALVRRTLAAQLYPGRAVTLDVVLVEVS